VDRSEGPEEEPFVYRAPLPPEDRLWRHPSELGASGPGARATSGAGAPLSFSGAPPSRARLATAVMVSATGALVVAGLVGMGLRLAGGGRATATAVVNQSATAFGFGAATTSAPVDQLSHAPGGVVQVVASAAGQERAGNGVVLDDHGIVATTAAVVEGATSVVAILSDGRRASALVLGIDAETGTAILSVSDEPDAADTGRATLLRPGAHLEVAAAPRLGATVDALGTQAMGRTGAALAHLVRLDLDTTGRVPEGAPVVDDDDDVVGVVTHDVTGDLYAIPIEIPRAAARSIAVHGRIIVPWLGVSGLDETTADGGGASVERVSAGSPAARAGLARGDVITTLDGQAVRSMATLALALRDYDAGAVVDVGYRRDGKDAVRSVMLAERR
jgi:putative serine protease PepD